MIIALMPTDLPDPVVPATKMRHPRQINHHRRAGDVLAQCHWQIALVLLPNAMVKNFAKQDRLPVLIRQFDANNILPGDNSHADDTALIERAISSASAMTRCDFVPVPD